MGFLYKLRKFLGLPESKYLEELIWLIWNFKRKSKKVYPGFEFRLFNIGLIGKLCKVIVLSREDTVYFCRGFLEGTGWIDMTWYAYGQPEPKSLKRFSEKDTKESLREALKVHLIQGSERNLTDSPSKVDRRIYRKTYRWLSKRLP